jgi:transposase-like protein
MGIKTWSPFLIGIVKTAIEIGMVSVFNMEGECAMNCPKCGLTDCTKDGIVKGKQRHKCKSCGYRHTVQQRGIADSRGDQARGPAIIP